MKCYTCSVINNKTVDYISGIDMGNRILLGSYDPLVVYNSITLNGVIRYVEVKNKRLYSKIIEIEQDDRCLVKLVYKDTVNIVCKFKNKDDEVVYISIEELKYLNKSNRKDIASRHNLSKSSINKLKEIKFLKRHIMRSNISSSIIMTDYIIIPENLVLSMTDSYGVYKGYVHFKNKLTTGLS